MSPRGDESLRRRPDAGHTTPGLHRGRPFQRRQLPRSTARWSRWPVDPSEPRAIPCTWRAFGGIWKTTDSSRRPERPNWLPITDQGPVRGIYTSRPSSSRADDPKQSIVVGATHEWVRPQRRRGKTLERHRPAIDDTAGGATTRSQIPSFNASRRPDPACSRSASPTSRHYALMPPPRAEGGFYRSLDRASVDRGQAGRLKMSIAAHRALCNSNGRSSRSFMSPGIAWASHTHALSPRPARHAARRWQRDGNIIGGFSHLGPATRRRAAHLVGY